jgi:catechol 2,3-dioxygenase-like lactoylglutathione lyase family enzyme
MSLSSLNATRNFRFMIALFFTLIAGGLYGQLYVPGIVGKNFIAMTVPNADSTSLWYENVFGLKLLKEIKTADGSAYGRIEGNEFLMVEILELKDSRDISDCNLRKQQAHLLQGFFKVGLFVSDVEKAEQYFRSKGIAIRHPLFHDSQTSTSAFILEDPNGNMLQFIQGKNRREN